MLTLRAYLVQKRRVCDHEVEEGLEPVGEYVRGVQVVRDELLMRKHRKTLVNFEEIRSFVLFHVLEGDEGGRTTEEGYRLAFVALCMKQPRNLL